MARAALDDTEMIQETTDGKVEKKRTKKERIKTDKNV
jgi:hypothetical protein